jgi:hypothetical protein
MQLGGKASVARVLFAGKPVIAGMLMVVTRR